MAGGALFLFGGGDEKSCAFPNGSIYCGVGGHWRDSEIGSRRL